MLASAAFCQLVPHADWKRHCAHLRWMAKLTMAPQLDATAPNIRLELSDDVSDL